jgi:hypothetical protein
VSVVVTVTSRRRSPGTASYRWTAAALPAWSPESRNVAPVCTYDDEDPEPPLKFRVHLLSPVIPTLEDPEMS